MERKWTRNELAPVLFTVRECTMLERVVQREMRRGSESVLARAARPGVMTTSKCPRCNDRKKIWYYFWRVQCPECEGKGIQEGNNV